MKKIWKPFHYYFLFFSYAVITLCAAPFLLSSNISFVTILSLLENHSFEGSNILRLFVVNGYFLLSISIIFFMFFSNSHIFPSPLPVKLLLFFFFTGCKYYAVALCDQGHIASAPPTLQTVHYYISLLCFVSIIDFLCDVHYFVASTFHLPSCSWLRYLQFAACTVIILPFLLIYFDEALLSNYSSAYEFIYVIFLIVFIFFAFYNIIHTSNKQMSFFVSIAIIIFLLLYFLDKLYFPDFLIIFRILQLFLFLLLLTFCIKIISVFLHQRQLEEYMDVQREYYNSLLEEYRQVRMFRHDIKNHMITLDILLKNQDISHAKEYLQELLDGASSNDVSFHTSSAALNATLHSKNTLASSKGISCDFHLDVKERLLISDFDLCTIVGNILDNAIAASADLHMTDPIYLKMFTKNSNLIFHLKNHYVPETIRLSAKGKLLTSKDTQLHGLGLQCVEHSLKKYNGLIDYKLGEQFELTLILPNVPR
ncbi:MAG: GHKL domain-containing protein [Lachnospiraceae bacterium]|nr:GHKL domain-containing protein [Lachnospiraceae bacterium]